MNLILKIVGFLYKKWKKKNMPFVLMFTWFCAMTSFLGISSIHVLDHKRTWHFCFHLKIVYPFILRKKKNLTLSKISLITPSSKTFLKYQFIYFFSSMKQTEKKLTEIWNRFLAWICCLLIAEWNTKMIITYFDRCLY